MADSPRRLPLLAVGLALLVLSFLVAATSLKGGVLQYDDASLLTGNGDLGEKGALNRTAGSFFTELYYEAYLPFYGLTYWVDGVLGASVESPMLFRVQNVLWHALASLLAYLVLLALLDDGVGALFGAMLFAVHPLHVESVAWIAERKDVVSGALFFLAWWAALKAEDGKRWGTALGLLAFLFACFTKASAVVLPALLVAAALFLPRYAERRRAAAFRTWPFWVAALLPAIVHVMVGVSRGVVREPRALGESLQAFVAGWGGSIQRTLVPLDLAIDYPEVRAATGAALILPGLLLLAVALVPLLLRKRAPVAAFGAAAFLAALAPFNNVFPATEILAADRYLYLPLFGLAAVVAWIGKTWRGSLPFVAVATAGCLVLSMLSGARFVDDETLWTKTLESRDESALAYVNRGLARMERGMRAQPKDKALLQTAVADLLAGARLAPLDEQKAKASLGMALPLLELGDADRARMKATEAIELTKKLEGQGARRFRASAHFQRGTIAKHGTGNWRQAAHDFQRAAELRPDHYDAWLEAGGAQLRTGLYEEGKKSLERAAALRPERPEPLIDLAALYRALDDRNQQKRCLDEALYRLSQLPPGDRGIREVARARTRFWLEQRSPDHQRARAELRSLPATDAERKMLEADVDAQYAIFLFRRGETKAAVAAADRARGNELRTSPSVYPLGHVYLDAGRFDDAVACYRAPGDGRVPARVRRNAIARAFTLKAYALLLQNDPGAARVAMAGALAGDADLIESGAAPLRGELALLRAARDTDLPLMAAAVVAGDATLALRLAASVLDGSPAKPDRLLVYRLRALLYAWTLDEYAAAEQDLRQVLADDENDLWGRFRLAQTWTLDGVRRWARGDHSGKPLIEKSIAALSKIVAEHPSFPFARLQRGEARFALGDTSGAKVDYESLREAGFAHKEVYLKEAVLHRLVFVRGGEGTNLAKAEELLHAALVLDPNYFDALFELGNIYHLYYDRKDDRGEKRRIAFSRAVLWYRRAMALNPRMPAPRVEWARICLKAENDALRNEEVLRAHQLVERLEAEAGDVPAVHKERVRLNVRTDFSKHTGIRPDAAFDAADQALLKLARLAPTDPELKELRALFHRTRGFSFYLTWAKLDGKKFPQHKEQAKKLAVREFKAAYAAWPDDPENGAVRDRLRELAPGLIMVDQGQAKAAHDRGVKAYEERRWQDAAAAFREALLLFPESTYHRYYLGLSLVRAGKRELALGELEKVANARDGAAFPGACFELGNHYLLAKNEMVAQVWYQRFLKLMVDREDDPRVKRARKILEEMDRG